MKIVFKVNQTAALRAGIDAPSSTVALDIEPANLPEAHREILAEALRDGHTADRHVWRGSRVCNTMPLMLLRPDLQGLQEELARVSALRAEVLAREAAVDQAADEANAKLHAELAGELPRATTQVTLCLDSQGVPCDVRNAVVKTSGEASVIVVPQMPDYYAHAYKRLSPETRALHERRVSEAQSELAAAIEALLPCARLLYTTWQSERAAERAEYDALYARLPEALRARDADGFAPETEVVNALQKLLRQDAGFVGFQGYQASTTADTLIDAEYAALVALRPAVPAGAEITLRTVNNWRYEPCDTHETYDSDCEDCGRQAVDVRTIAIVEWTRATVDVTAKLVLTLDLISPFGDTVGSYLQRRHVAHSRW